MDKKKVVDGIKQLESLDVADPHVADRAIEAYKSIGKLPFLILDHPGLPINIFHSRTHTTDNFFEDFSEIELPPSQFVKSFARCNVPGQSVFYGSDFRPTSYAELIQYWAEEKKEEFLYVTIGKWHIKNSLKLLVISSPIAEDRLMTFDKQEGIKLDHFINQHEGDEKEAMILFYKFIFDRFRKPAKHDLLTYIITSSYCNLAFNNAKGAIDGIIYPSVPYNGEGVNVAIKAEYTFKDNAELLLVARNKFKRIEGDLPTFQEIELIPAAELDQAKRKIIWKKP